MASFDYDVLVIGGGAAGIVCARLLAKQGKSVAVVEAGRLGGDTQHFRIPLNALLESARVYKEAKNSKSLGLGGEMIGFNYPRVQAWQNQALSKTGFKETEASLISGGVNVIQGSAHFIDAHTISVGRARFRAKQFVVSTGAKFGIGNIHGLLAEDIHGAPDALTFSRPPKTVVIMGGNTVGVELATALSSFGSKVYLVERASRILPDSEPLAGEAVKENLELLHKVTCITHGVVQSGARRGLKKQLIIKEKGGLRTVLVDHVIDAQTMIRQTDIGLENAGVRYGSGGIEVNEKLQTSAGHIYAIGAVKTGASSVQQAVFEGRVLAHNLTSPKRRLKTMYEATPRVVFSNPELATVGKFEPELVTAMVPLEIVGKSNVSIATQGFVRLGVEKKTGKLRAASIVAPHASEMIHELVLAVSSGLTASDIAKSVHAFSSWSEAIHVAANKLAKKI